MCLSERVHVCMRVERVREREGHAQSKKCEKVR